MGKRAAVHSWLLALVRVIYSLKRRSMYRSSSHRAKLDCYLITRLQILIMIKDMQVDKAFTMPN